MTLRNSTLFYPVMLIAALSLSTVECVKKQSAGIPSEKPATHNPTATTDTLSAELTTRLKTVFADSQIAAMAEYRQCLASITDSVSFAKAYRYAGKLSTELSPALSASFEKRPDQNSTDIATDWMAPAIPGFSHGIYAEGTAAGFEVDLNYFLERAAGVCPQFGSFHKLLSLCYDGNSLAYPKWEIRDWDYGGANALGNGLQKNVLSLIDTILPTCGIFSSEINTIRTQVLDNIIKGSDLFGYYDSERNISNEEWQARIQTEIDQILKSVNLTTDERANIIDRRSKPFPSQAKITG